MPRLEIVNGKSAGTVVDLGPLASQGTITLGNRRTAHVVVKDPWVSFMHAVLAPQGSGWTVADKRSKAGTFLNGAAVGLTGAPLKHGDTIALGKTQIRFLDEGDAAAAAAPAAADVPATSGPFTAPTAAPIGGMTPRPASPFEPVAPAAPVDAALEKAQAEVKSLRLALAAREQALGEAQTKLRAAERAASEAPAAGSPEAEQRAARAEAHAQQLQQALEETAAKARIRIEELGRLNQALEARLAQGGAGAAVAQEREVAQLREELRQLRETARQRFEALTQEKAALEQQLRAGAGDGGASSEELEAARREAVELERELDKARSALGEVQQGKLDLELALDDLKDQLKLRAQEIEELQRQARAGAGGAKEEVAARGRARAAPRRRSPPSRP